MTAPPKLAKKGRKKIVARREKGKDDQQGENPFPCRKKGVKPRSGTQSTKNYVRIWGRDVLG